MKLVIENIDKTFMNNRREHKVLENINLSVDQGEFI